MQNTKFMLWTLFCLLTTAFHTQAQSPLAPYPLKVSVLDESLILPGFKFLQYGYNPALMVGTEYKLNNNPVSSWHLTGNLGFFYHAQSQTGIFLNSEFGYRYHLNRWNFRLGTGLGYLHGFSNRPVYKREEGILVESTDFGSPTLMISASAEIGYQLKPGEQQPELFLTWMNSAEVPFNFYTGIHQFVGIGIKFYPFKSKS